MSELRLTKKGNTVAIEQDTGSHSCGENRYNWRTLRTFDAKDFYEKILKLHNNEQMSIYLGETHD